MAATDEKILQALEQHGKLLENLQKGQTRLEEGQVKLEKGQVETNKRLSTLEDGQSTLLTTVKAVGAGLDDLRADVAETKAATLRNGVKLDKYQKQNEVRLDNLEEKTSTHNPTKN